jgi:hypothetical protein
MCNEEENNKTLDFKSIKDFNDYLKENDIDLIKIKFLTDLRYYIDTILNDDKLDDKYKLSLNFYLSLLSSLSFEIDTDYLIMISELINREIIQKSGNFYLN